MSGSEVGSIEYLRSLVDSDSAIAIQCRDALVDKCKALAGMVDGSPSVKEIDAMEYSIRMLVDLVSKLEQRLYHLCQLSFELHDADFDMSIVFPDSEELEPLMVKFKNIMKGEDCHIKKAVGPASVGLRIIERWRGQTFQHGHTNAYGDEDDPKFWENFMRDEEIEWPDRTLHPSYGRRNNLLSCDLLVRSRVSAIEDRLELLGEGAIAQ